MVIIQSISPKHQINCGQNDLKCVFDCEMVDFGDSLHFFNCLTLSQLGQVGLWWSKTN